MNEGEAIRLCQGGDRDAFRYLVEGHKDVLFGTAYLMTGDRALSEDLVQESFLAAWKGIRDFRNDLPAKPWLVRILVNRTLSYRRRQRPEPPVDEATPPRNGQHGEDLADRIAGREALRVALATLPEEQRQTVTLRFFADLSIAEIGTAMSCPEPTVRTRLHRAMGHLREQLQSQS